MSSYTKETREEALMRLMNTYGDGIKRMCCVYLKDLHMAEDAAQETFIKAFSHIDKLLEGAIGNERAWLSRIAINTCKDMLRSPWQRILDRRRSIEELPLAASSSCEDSLALTDAISRLPQKHRDIVLLHYYQGLNLRICAKVLDISAPTATRRLAQAQKRLRTDLERG